MARPGMTDVNEKLRPVVLLILDGWGLSSGWAGNPIVSANPPTFEYLWKYYPHTILQSYKLVTGPSGKVGSSEIGHVSIGTGRIVNDDLSELDLAIETGLFYENHVLQGAIRQAANQGKAVHLMGLLSEGGIHASAGHARALVRMAKNLGVKELWVHPFTDGRDVPPRSALAELAKLEAEFTATGIGRIGTVIGRHYAMDRDNNWGRTEAAYRALVTGEGKRAESAEEALKEAYRQDLGDEFVPPTVIESASEQAKRGAAFIPGRVQPGDIVIHWNFRPDRAWQLLRAFLDKRALCRFGLVRRVPIAGVGQLVTLTESFLPLEGLSPAFPPATIENTLGQMVANHRLKQLRVAESEKASHVTYFFNGGRPEPYAGEDRLIIPSPKVKSFEAKPAMAAGQLTRAIERAVASGEWDLIVANFANIDMVARTRNLKATETAVLVVDEAVRRIVNATTKAKGAVIVTADHGLPMLTKGAAGTVPVSQAPLPFIFITPTNKRDELAAAKVASTNSFVAKAFRSKHTLADVSPTVLDLSGIAKPSDMTGSSLLGELE